MEVSMKRVITSLMVVLFLLVGNALAFNWVTANQVTMAWDAVTSVQTTNGTQPLPEGDYIEYELFLSTQTDHSDAWSVGTTTDTQFTFTFEQEGEFYGGGKAIRYDSTGTKLSESIIAWSDQEEYVATDTFGFKYYYIPLPLTGLR